MKTTPPSVVAVLVTSVSLNVGLGTAIFAGTAGDKPFYDSATAGGGAGIASFMALLAFWGLVVAARALRKEEPPSGAEPRGGGAAAATLDGPGSSTRGQWPGR